jgi:hypothetical protein
MLRLLFRNLVIGSVNFCSGAIMALTLTILAREFMPLQMTLGLRQILQRILSLPQRRMGLGQRLRE